MKSQQAKSVASSYRKLTKSKQQSFFRKYVTCFFIKHPLLNPIFARHERVNRFSRGLIHYTQLSLLVLIIAAWLQGMNWVQTEWKSAIFCLFVNFVVARTFNEVMYALHNYKFKYFWLVVTTLNLVAFIGIWILIHFLLNWLPWKAFENIWWLGPDTIALEGFWEVFVNIPHICLADRLISNKNNFTSKGKQGKRGSCSRWLCERFVVNNVILTYLSGY